MIFARYFRFVTVCLMACLLGQARADETVKLDAVVTHADRGPDDPVVFSGLAGFTPSQRKFQIGKFRHERSTDHSTGFAKRPAMKSNARAGLSSLFG